MPKSTFRYVFIWAFDMFGTTLVKCASAERAKSSNFVCHTCSLLEFDIGSESATDDHDEINEEYGFICIPKKECEVYDFILSIVRTRFKPLDIFSLSSHLVD